jgi:transcriptional regulator with XRE-family HTH domain
MNLNIGQYLRKVRKNQGLTLLELSRKSNVALGTLSRIETGDMTGTLESHMQITKALGQTLAEFYGEVERLTATQREQKETAPAKLFVHSKGTSSTILAKDIFNKKMLPVLIELKPGAKTQTDELKVGTEKFIYVLSGKIAAVVAKDKKVLSKDATLYFDASLPHYIKNIGKIEATYLCIATPVNL